MSELCSVLERESVGAPGRWSVSECPRALSLSERWSAAEPSVRGYNFPCWPRQPRLKIFNHGDVAEDGVVTEGRQECRKYKRIPCGILSCGKTVKLVPGNTSAFVKHVLSVGNGGCGAHLGTHKNVVVHWSQSTMVYAEDGSCIKKLTFEEQPAAHINAVFVVVECNLRTAAMATRAMKAWIEEYAPGSNRPAQKTIRKFLASINELCNEARKATISMLKV